LNGKVNATGKKITTRDSIANELQLTCLSQSRQSKVEIEIRRCDPRRQSEAVGSAG
jgi:hypothetical protein